MIKSLTLDEFDKLKSIWPTLKNPEKFETRMHTWRSMLEENKRIIIVYEEGGTFIGELGLMFDIGDPDYTISGQRICLTEMTVHKDFRNKGIGSSLIDYACIYAISCGYSEMSVGVDNDNLSARHLYEKKGFTAVIREDEDEGGKYVKLLKKLIYEDNGK
jgi:Acetyltransferases